MCLCTDTNKSRILMSINIIFSFFYLKGIEQKKDEQGEKKQKERDNKKKRKKNSATCEARTHDLQIMRLTRCRLRQGGTCVECCQNMNL